MSAATRHVPSSGGGFDAWEGHRRLTEQAARVAAMSELEFAEHVRTAMDAVAPEVIAQALELVHRAEARGPLPALDEQAASAAAVRLVDEADAPPRTRREVLVDVGRTIVGVVSLLLVAALAAVMLVAWLGTPAGAAEPTPTPTVVTEVIDVARPDLTTTCVDGGTVFILAVLVSLAAAIAGGLTWQRRQARRAERAGGLR